MAIRDNDRLTYLFTRYYERTASEEEEKEFARLVTGAKGDEELARALEEAWGRLSGEAFVFGKETSRRILENILPPARREETALPAPRRNRLYYAAAAVLVFISMFAYWKWSSQPTVSGSTAGTGNIQPGSDRAVLILANGMTIDLDGKSGGRLAELNGVTIRKDDQGRLRFDLSGPVPNDDRKLVSTVATPRGGQYRVVLPDSSIVWLNAASSIKFPTAFTPEERVVTVEGEVYFEVKKDPSRPFRVHFGKNSVEVLGTSFNLMSYPEEATSEITLAEGAVALRIAGKESRIRPGQQARVTADGACAVAEVNVSEVTAWKNGFFQFQEATIETVMRQLSRWYDITITYEGEVPRKQFTGRIPREVTLEEGLEMLRFAGVDCRLQGRSIVVR